MSQMLAIAGRELRAYFLSPGGYVVAALFILAEGWFFVRYVFGQGETATLQPIFAISMLLFALLCPAVTMRMIS
ncbi:MAG: ABC transporter, partial [Phycisphaerales bacterium]